MRYVVLALPFLVVLLGTPLAASLAGDEIGNALGRAALPPGVGGATRAAAAPVADEDRAEYVPPKRMAARMPPPARNVTAAPDGGAPADPGNGVPSDPLTAKAKGTIVVVAAAVSRALEKKDVSATNATASDGTPLGARLAGVGKYKTGLRDGDVVVSVEGRRTATVEAMIGAAMSAAMSGATKLRGRVVRGGEAYDVVLEVPK